MSYPETDLRQPSTATDPELTGIAETDVAVDDWMVVSSVALPQVAAEGELAGQEIPVVAADLDLKRVAISIDDRVDATDLAANLLTDEGGV